MSLFLLYAISSIALFSLGLHGFLFRAHLLRKVLALNIMSSGAFLLLIALAERNRGPEPDPVPHAMVLTGIVVALSVTAFALALVRKVFQDTGAVVLPEEGDT